MPHKHKRKVKGGEQIYDLPPTALAKPLPVGKQGQPGSKKRKHGGSSAKDDTPKEFMRLMQLQEGKRLRSGPDEGIRPTKKQKKSVDADQAVAEEKPREKLKILPGESMSEFSARVDQSLPIAGLRRKGVKVPGIKERQTKAEKKMHRIQNEWREEEAKLKDAREEEQDMKDQEEAEDWTVSESAKTKAKGKRDDDPWEQLKHKREKPAGIHDVVQEPPTFKKLPREIFKVRSGAKVNVANVPTTSGSLRRREELGEARQSIIDQYRKMMDGKRGG